MIHADRFASRTGVLLPHGRGCGHQVQWQPQPPPQHPPDEDGAAFALLPLPVLNTDNFSLLRVPSQRGQATACCLFSTIFSYSLPQSSQTYS
jgi:hypothetical protein